jgi:hypothetical protein
VPGLTRRCERALALARGQLEPNERGRHGSPYGENHFLMANIEGGPYGRNYVAMAIFSGGSHTYVRADSRSNGATARLVMAT